MDRPYVEIIEQPAEKSFRFRYESEGRNSGSILGVHSTRNNLSYPKLRVHNHNGPATVVVSCVFNDKNHPSKFRQHPHKLTSKTTISDTADAGTYVRHFNVCPSIIEFKDIGIVFVKKENIYKSLSRRREKKVDPTGGGWAHIDQPQHINLHCLRLCFQVLTKIADSQYVILGHAVSNEIMDKKSHGLPKIVEISTTKSPVQGGERILLFCDRVKRNDISIIFYEEEKIGNVIRRVWEHELKHENSKSLRIHHQFGIAFHTPSYKDLSIDEARQTFIQLYRPSDQEYSEPLKFEFTPNKQKTRSIQLDAKRRKKMDDKALPLLNAFASNQTKKNGSKLKSTKTISNTHGNHLNQTNRNNDLGQPAIQQTVNEQPLIDFSHVEEKENAFEPYLMPNAKNVNTNQMAGIQYSHYPWNDAAQDPYTHTPSTYYPPNTQPSYAKGHFDNNQTNVQSLMPTNIHQQSQQQQQPHTINMYADERGVNEYAAGVQNMYPLNTMNNIPLVYNNFNIPPNCQDHSPVSHTRPAIANSDANLLNFSDMVQSNTNELYEAARKIDHLTEIGRLSSNLEMQLSIEEN